MSSSPAWTRPGCWCVSGSASRVRVRSPGTRSPCPVHHQGRRTSLVRRRETRGGPELARAATAVDPNPGRTQPTSSEPHRRGTQHGLGPCQPPADATAQIRNLARTAQAAAADAAWATAGTLHVAASLSTIGDSSRAMQAVAGSPGCPGSSTGSRGCGWRCRGARAACRAAGPARGPRCTRTIRPAGTVLRWFLAATATARGRCAPVASSAGSGPQPGSHQGTCRRCPRRA
jgi:hypothetical protein